MCDVYTITVLLLFFFIWVANNSEGHLRMYLLPCKWLVLVAMFKPNFFSLHNVPFKIDFFS